MHGTLASKDDNGDERTVHRLEAFSDIVIGFCIAEMGLNLIIPKSAVQLPSIAVGAYGFSISFVLIAIVWWIHHRLFKSIFVLNTAMVIVNFAMLGALVLMVYFQQICVHLIATGDDIAVALQLWFGSYGVVYALLSIMLWTGLRARWTALSDDDLRWAFGRAVLASLGSLLFLLNIVIIGYRIGARELFVVPLIVVLTARLAIGGVTSRIIKHRALAKSV